MKMTATNFADLKAAFDVVLKEYFKADDAAIKGMALVDAWVVFGEVWSQRSYDDSHPRWKNKERVLPADYADKWYGGQSGYLAHVYHNEGHEMNADHIRTALKKIIASYQK